MESDKIGGILDKIESKAGLIGGILGFMNDPMADGRGISSQTGAFMMDRIMRWHIPDPIKILGMEMWNPGGYPIFSYAIGGIAGWVLQQAGPTLDSRLGQLGRMVKKMSFTALIANIASGFIWLPAVNPGGVSGGAETASMNPQASFAVGGPGTPHASAANGYRNTMRFEGVS